MISPDSHPAASAAAPRFVCQALPLWTDNYVWLLHDAHKAAVVVDPGAAEPVLHHLQVAGLHLVAILLTHHHPDHIGGVADLRGQLDVSVYGPADPRLPVTDPVGEGDHLHLDWQGGVFAVLDLPGHTRSHVGYRVDRHLYSGDVLFAAGCGRLFEGTPAQGWASLQRIAALPDDTWIHAAHEYTAANLRFAQAVFPADPSLAQASARVHALRAAGLPTLPTTVADERRLNPFLRMLDPAWRAALGQPHLVDDPAAAFAWLRAWKDRFH